MPPAFTRVKPILACLGKSVVHMGGSGMGQATKLINNMIVAADFAAVCEAWGLGVKVGLDPATLHEAIKGGWAGSRVMEETVPRLLWPKLRPRRDRGHHDQGRRLRPEHGPHGRMSRCR